MTFNTVNTRNLTATVFGGLVLVFLLAFSAIFFAQYRLILNNDKTMNSSLGVQAASLNMSLSIDRINDRIMKIYTEHDRLKSGEMIFEINQMDDIIQKNMEELGNSGLFTSEAGELKELFRKWQSLRMEIISNLENGSYISPEKIYQHLDIFKKIELIGNRIAESTRNRILDNSGLMEKYFSENLYLYIFLFLLLSVISFFAGYYLYSRISNLLIQYEHSRGSKSGEENKFRNLFESSVDCLLITEMDGTILDINRKGHTRLGYRKEELLGKNVSFLVSSKFQDIVPERLSRINRDGFYQFESEHRCKDGQLIPIEVLAHQVNYDGKVRLFSINRNISERKNLENSLKENMARYKAVIETTRDGFLIINLRGEILEANDAYLDHSGYSREEILLMRYWDLTANETVEKSLGKIHRVFRDGYDQFEAHHQTKEGQKWPVEISATFWEENNNLIFLFIRDISERKSYLSQLEESENKLRVLFENANDELMLLDSRGMIVDINFNGHNRLGYAKNEMVGRPISDFISQESVKKSSEIMEKLFSEGGFAFEAENISKNGEIIPLEINARLIEQQGEKFIFSIGRDISERKKMERTLRENEEKFRALFENANDGMHILDLDGRIMDVNFSGASRLGYSKKEMIGRSILDFVPQDALSRQPGLIKKVLEKGFLTFESAHVHKNGRVIPMEINAQVIEQGGQKYFFSVNRDVSLRKEIEEVLIKREAKYRAIIETSADGFWITDMTGRFLEVNDAYIRQSGYSRSELLSMRITDVEALETEVETKEHIETLKNIGSTKFETMHRRRDGSKWPVEIHASYHNIDHGLFFVFIHDISDRREYLERLKDNEHKFRAMFENANDGLIMLDTKGIIVDINNKGYSRLLYKKEEMVGRKITDFLSENCARNYSSIIPEVLKEGSMSFECTQIRKDGFAIPVDVNSQLITQNDQKYIFNIARDISARKEIEEILAKRESKYRAVIETSSEGFFITDLEGQILEVNDSYLQKSGYSREELQRKNIMDLTSGHSHPEMIAKIQKIISKGHGRFESSHVTRWGENWPVEVIANYWTIDGGRLFVFVIDISERIRTLKMLEDSERKFRMMFDNTNDYLMLVSLDGIIMEMNPVGIKNLGYEKEEIIGAHLETVVSAKNSDEIIERIRRVNEDFVILESTYVCKDGTEIQVEVNLCVIEKNGQKYQFSLARDITERKKELQKMKTREAISRAVINKLLDS